MPEPSGLLNLILTASAGDIDLRRFDMAVDYAVEGTVLSIRKWEPPASGGFWFPGYTVTVGVKTGGGEISYIDCMCRGVKYSEYLTRCSPGQPVKAEGDFRRKKFRDESGKLHSAVFLEVRSMEFPGLEVDAKPKERDSGGIER